MKTLMCLSVALLSLFSLSCKQHDNQKDAYGGTIDQEQVFIIGVAGFSHESNTFSSQPTVLEDFDIQLGEPPDQRAKRFFASSSAKTMSSGYIEGAKRSGLELYPCLQANASPKGVVTDNTFNTIMNEILSQLQAGPKLDGILLNLHGAMVVESYPDGEEEILRRVRETFGPDLPVVVTHDFHGNITPKCIEYSDVLITYKENPHLDTYDRGLQAAEIMAKTCRGKVKPTQYMAKPPMFLNQVFLNTFSEPLLPIVTESKNSEKHEKILAASVAGGYQYSDVYWMGPSVVVVTDNDPGLAEKEANRLSDMLWGIRHKTVFNLPDPAKAVKLAMEHDGRPVVLIDMGDNIGGGSPGDATFLLEELVRQKASGWVMVIADPEGYLTAEKAGIGNSIEFNVGGKTDADHGKPVYIKGLVKSLNLGRYVETEVRHGGGRYWDMGKTAVIQVEGSTLEEPNLLLLTTERSSPNSIHQLVSNGVYVERQKIIVVKGAIAPRAAYEPVASIIISVDSPGATAVNPKYFEYKHVREGLFGME
jgi:microcystin degradation protein MlrC